FFSLAAPVFVGGLGASAINLYMPVVYAEANKGIPASSFDVRLKNAWVGMILVAVTIYFLMLFQEASLPVETMIREEPSPKVLLLLGWVFCLVMLVQAFVASAALAQGRALMAAAIPTAPA